MGKTFRTVLERRDEFRMLMGGLRDPGSKLKPRGGGQNWLRIV